MCDAVFERLVFHVSVREQFVQIVVIVMWTKKFLTVKELEREANEAARELDLDNSGEENSDSDGSSKKDGSDFEIDDPLFHPSEHDDSESSDFDEGVVRKRIRKISPVPTIGKQDF